MDNLRNILKKINISGELHFNEPMSLHTTFETGGPADIYIAPADPDELKDIMHLLKDVGIPSFIIGGGANLLVSDRGIDGAVIDTRNFNRIEIKNDRMSCGSGVVMDRAAEAALEAGLGGLDAFYGMPGTVGGAVWMNARCYGISISDIIVTVRYLDEKLNINSMSFSEGDFEYKKSPFQSMNCTILDAEFRLSKKNRAEIERTMKDNREDRDSKGHYAGPSAGSVFKNNRDFGKPSGAIIDSLGLRGTRIGGAMISERHANIIINSGNASSADIYRLINLVMERVREAYGFILEPEVQLTGDFTYLN